MASQEVVEMEDTMAADRRPQIDREFLDSVGEELERALQRTTELEVGLEYRAAESNSAWKGALENMSLSLAAWESRLGDLSRQTTLVESQLQVQENALRDWFQSLGVTSTRLSQAASSPETLHA